MYRGKPSPPPAKPEVELDFTNEIPTQSVEPSVRHMGAEQSFPFPTVLSDLVQHLRYKPGWHFWLGHKDRGQGCSGLTFEVILDCTDSEDPSNLLTVAHIFPVPAAAYNERSWQRWLFERILQVEQHEAMEYFRIGNAKPYAPLHGPGWDPYLVTELASDVDKRTDWRGIVHDA